MRALRREHMDRCVKDVDLLRLYWNGCAHAPWAEYAAKRFDAQNVSDAAPITMINVGANKGYGAPAFLSLWSESLRARLRAKEWKWAIQRYARTDRPNKTHGFLIHTPDGPCHESSLRREAHTRELPAQVHMLELLAANRRLLRWLVNHTQIANAARVYDYAVSNVTYTQPVIDGYAGVEYLSLSSQGKKSKAKPTMMQVLTVDDFMTRERINHAVWSVEIDTEGWDALVLEGMRGALREHRVLFVEFEYSSRGFWKQFKDRRTLYATQRWMGDLGYTCYLETSHDVAPISGHCWRDEFEASRWSNVVCTHSEILHDMAQEGYARRIALKKPS